MRTMKQTNMKLGRMQAQAAKEAATLEDLLFAGRQIYNNTAVEAANAEVYALRHTVEHLFNLVQAQQASIGDLIKEVNTLKAQALKPSNRTIYKETTIKEVVVEGHHEYVASPPYYHESGRINWNYADKDDVWTPMAIIFNEWDIFRHNNNLKSMFTPEDVKRNWSTVYSQTPKLVAANMTLKKLMKIYAQERGLNFG